MSFFTIENKNIENIERLFGQTFATLLKYVRGWKFLTMKAAETLCIVWLPPEEHIS